MAPGLRTVAVNEDVFSRGCSDTLWGKETRSRTVSGLVVWIWCRLSQTRCRIRGPRHHLAPTGGAVSARSRSMRGGLSIAERLGGYRRAVSRASSVTWRSRPQECTRPWMHSGALGCRGIVMDRFVGLGRARVLAHHPGPRREVLQAVVLGRSTGGEEAVRRGQLPGAGLDARAPGCLGTAFASTERGRSRRSWRNAGSLGERSTTATAGIGSPTGRSLPRETGRRSFRELWLALGEATSG